MENLVVNNEDLLLSKGDEMLIFVIDEGYSYLDNFKLVERELNLNDYDKIDKIAIVKSNIDKLKRQIREQQDKRSMTVMDMGIITVSLSYIKDTPTVGLKRKVFQDLNKGYRNINIERMLQHVGVDRKTSTEVNKW